MKEVTVSGKTYEIRAWTRKEVRSARLKGLNLRIPGTPDPAMLDETFDHGLELVFGENWESVVPDSQVESDLLFRKIHAETFGNPEAEKN